MSDVFTGLVAESAEDKAAWQSKLMTLPPFAAEERVKEKRWELPLPFIHDEDQEQTNSCSGHGGTTSVEATEFGETGQVVQLSRWGLYILAQKRCGLYGRDVGATLGGVHEALRLDGCPTEEAWPFPGHYDPTMPDGAMESAALRKMTHSIDVESGGYDSARTVIGQNIGGVVFACSWPFQIWDGNRVEEYRPYGRGGHCMSWAALSVIEDRDGNPYFIGPNSHRNLPYLLWAPRAVEAVLQIGGWGSFGVCRMTTPKPREVDWVKNSPFKRRPA